MKIQLTLLRAAGVVLAAIAIAVIFFASYTLQMWIVDHATLRVLEVLREQKVIP
jgi:hypothetical protein